MQPTTASPPPTRDACKILGKRTFQIITSYISFISVVSITLFIKGILLSTSFKLSTGLIDDDPTDAETTIHRNKKTHNKLI